MQWAFWPPGTDASKLSETGDGIWIRRDDDGACVNSDSDGEEEMEHDRVPESGDETSEEDKFLDEEEEEEEEESSKEATMVGGRFGALALEDTAAQSTSSEED